MKNVDLNTYRFDYDLTFSVLLMHPDGTIYHRYGGRNHENAMSWMSMKSFLWLLKKTLPEHEKYKKNPDPPRNKPKRTVMNFPEFRKKQKNKRKGKCVHCHMVNKAAKTFYQKRGSWSRKQIWMYPPPERIGLTMESVHQNRVAEVKKNSPAAQAGLKKGDVIHKMNQQRILTVTDIQWVLDNTPFGGGSIDIDFRRNGNKKQIHLSLQNGWKVGNPLTFSWRPFKWALKPAPGFGGKEISDRKKKQLGLQPDDFAFKVKYIVTWGKNSHLGRNAKKAGIRKNDVVYSVGGKSDFEGVKHFHSWFRLKLRPGQRIPIKLIRNGKKKTITLLVIQ